MACYRGGDGHYADVECACAELERYLVLSCNELSPLLERKPPSTGGLSHEGGLKDAAHNPTTGSQSASLTRLDIVLQESADD